MNLEKELSTLSRCYDLFDSLDDDAKVRAFQWLSNKFKLGQTTLTIASETPVSMQSPMVPGVVTQAPKEATPTGVESFNSFEELFKFIKPSSDSEKALVAAVYLQLKKDLSDLTSAQVQKELKRINNRVSNITQAISALVKKNMMIQLSKEGNSQQARKKYKVTLEGIKQIAESIERS